MKKSTKILVLLLSMVLILAGLLIAASAEESVPGATYVDANGATQTATDLATAIANAKEGTTVTLTGNTTVDASITVTKTITIDLNGYTLTTTCNKVFITDTNHKNFTIKGNGTISATGILINSSKKNFTQKLAIEGDEKGIVINHDGTSSKSLLYASSGDWKISNVNITSTNIGNSYLIQTATKGGMHSLVNYEFNSVKINAKNAETAGTNEVVNSGTYTASILRMGGRTTAVLNYCNFSGNVSAFTFENQVDDLDVDGDGNKTEYMETGDFLKINNSYINMSHGYAKDNVNDDIGIFGAYAEIGGNIVVNNSHLRSSAKPIFIKYTHNNSAVILNNSVIEQNGTNRSQIARSANIVINEGSAIWFANGYTNYMMSHDEGYKAIFHKGARIDADMYNGLITEGKTAAANATSASIAVYEDGSSLKDSTTYKFVYDPQGSTEHPYVVVDYDYVATDTPTYEYALSTSVNSGFSQWHQAGTLGNVTSVNNNSYWRYISSGLMNTDGSKPEYMFTKASITQNAHDVVVVETDFAGDIFGGFTALRFGVHTNGKNTGFFSIKNDGTVDDYYKLAVAGATTKISLGEWHRITVVIDIKNSNTAYCYIDGAYYGSKTMAIAVKDGTGLRFSIDGATDANSSLYVDNVSVRGYGDGTGSALTDNGAKFLSANGGKAVNKDKVASDTVKTALGYPVATLNDLPYIAVNLARDVDLKQTITENGVKVAANGYNLTYTKESLPAYITLGSENTPAYYDFDSSYGTVAFKFFTGDFTNSEALLDAANWFEAAVKLGHTPIEFYAGPEMKGGENVERNNHWYNETFKGWALVNGAAEADATATTPVYPEFATANKDKAVELYPAYKMSLAHTTAVILNADGSFNRGISKGTSVYASGWDLVLLAYGETLVLQQDINSQTSLNRIFTADSKASGTAEKVINLDLNGHVIKIDSNLTQDEESYNSAINSVLSTECGETVNVYSSYPGGKIANYGVKNGVATGGILFQVNGGVSVNGDDLATIEANANGEVTQFNTTLNIGTVTVNGKTIPGSNLTLEASSIINAVTGDSTCKINVDGVTAVKNSADFTGMFVNRNYFGEMNITNCVIVNPVNNAIADGHQNSIIDTDADGALELTDTRALGKMLFDNCVIAIKNDGGNIINNNYSLESLTFTNCTTNGRIGGSKLKNVVVIGEGNTVFELAANNFTEGTVKANWNNEMTLGGKETITVSYITLNPDVEITSKDWDYITTSYVIAINGYEGEADQVLPVLPCKTVASDEALTVIFNNVDGTVNTKAVYANGGKMVSVPTPESYVGTIVTLTTDGTYDKEVATVVTESVTYTPNFIAKANITGLKANLSLYANFNVNLYVPAEYKNAVTVSGYDFTEVNVNGVDYLQVTAPQLCSNATDAIVFTLNVSEAGYTAEATVTVSIVSYATSILEDSKATFTDSDKVLMCYMLDYANEAEAFFDGEANATIENLLSTYAAYTAKYNYVQNYEDKKISNTNLSKAFNSASVSLESAPAFVLTLKDGFVGTVTVKYGENNVRTYNVTELTQREIVIEGMKVYNFGTYLEISVEGTIVDEQISITNGKYTLDTFAAYHLGNANDATSETQAASAKALKLISALSAYAEVAELYKTGALEAAINPAA